MNRIARYLRIFVWLAVAASVWQAQAAVRTDVVTVLYRKDAVNGPTRLDPAVQAVTLALEQEFIRRDYKVIQPSADVYKLMDEGPAVIITFAPDAGFSLVFAVYRDTRPMPGVDIGISEVRIEARVFVGRVILAAETGRGQVQVRTEAATREYGERRAFEIAAQKAAAELSERVYQRLKALTPDQITAMAQAGGARITQSETVPVQAPPPPPAPAPAPIPAPLPSPSPAPTPAPLPAPPVAAPVPLPLPTPPVAAPLPAPTAVAVPAPIGGALPPPANKWALVVGVSDYTSVRNNTGEPGWKDLPGVAKDVNNVESTLTKLGFARERMAVFRDAQATGAAMRNTLKQFAGKVGPDDLVFIFMSGHGADREYSYSGYGMPVLADFVAVKEPNALDFWELQSMVTNLRGRVVWVIDTCHSGGAAANIASVVVSAGGVKVSTGVQGPDAATVARNAGTGQDFAILTASSPSEISWDTSDGGLFTTRLLRAWLGSSGQEPVGTVFNDKVSPAVVAGSKEICQRAKQCAEHPQQTPTLATRGSGERIRF